MDTEVMLERIPPQNLDAEQSVIGSMLIEKEAITKAEDMLQAEDFYKDAHRLIFKAIIGLANAGEPVDMVTLMEALRKEGTIEQVGGASYLAALANYVPTAANVEYYAKIVFEKSILRKLINAATRVATLGYEAKEEVENILDESEQLILNIAKGRSSNSIAPIKKVIFDVLDKIDKLYGTQGGITGVPTGFTDLDKMTSGLQPSDLIIIAARPAMGKTSFCLNLAQNAAIQHKVPAAIFSLEMSKEQLVQRMLCSEARIDAHRLRTGNLNEDDFSNLSYAVGKLSEAPIFIDDVPGLTIMELRARARRLKVEHGLGLIVIDYLQLMQGRGKTESRQQEISEISRSLKGLARELNVPIIALSQLSREVEKRQNKRPMLSDLRESGSLEQDTDIVAFIYRDDYYNPDTDKPNTAEIIIAKHRNGPVGTVDLYFSKEHTKFISMDRFHN